MITIKKPDFKRQDSHKKPKLGDKWRRPRGLQSKMRLGKKGYRRSPSLGYGAPAESKGKTPGGLLPVVIFKIDDLEGLDKSLHGVVIGSSVGNRNKVEIVKKAESQGLKVLNVKEGFVNAVEAGIAEKKKKKGEAEKAKKSKLEERKKKALEKEKEEAEAGKPEEDDKKAQKKEMDKILTTKE